MNRFKTLFGHFGFHFFLFVLAVVLFSRPFAGPEQARQAEAMFGYLFAIWGLIIAFLFLQSSFIGADKPKNANDPGEENKHV